MEKPCTPSPTDKRKYISDIGKILVADHGKKKYYLPEDVKKAHKKSTWNDWTDFSCWGMSTFSSHEDFDAYHENLGEACDYISMKKEMLNGLSASPITNWEEIPDLDIDASWLDFGDVFEGIFEGIGELVVGIFEGLA